MVTSRKPVDLAFEIQAKPEKPEIMLDEPGYLSFRVGNPSTRNLKLQERLIYRDFLGRPPRFRVQVIDEDGNRLPEPQPRDDSNYIPFDHDLPIGGEHVFRLFLPHWVRFKRPGRYTLTISTTLEVETDTERCEVPATATTAITVIPTDANRLAEFIARAGEELLSDNVSEAHRMLSAMHDERIIPYYIKLSERPRMSARLVACDGLERYETDDSLAALRDLAETKAEDLQVDKGDPPDYAADQVSKRATRAIRHLQNRSKP
jgi:hypothetical protein